MTRFLLALLAMLSGIVAAGQPVAARVCAEEASALQSVDCPALTEGVSERALPGPIPGSVPDRMAASTAPREGFAVAPVRTVHIRCDRALE
jgi:hypothetical protein